ncbi:hypothetical protein ACSQ67_010677 [Phaseolus vulgaris]
MERDSGERGGDCYGKRCAILNNGATMSNASRKNRSGATDSEENNRRARRRRKRRDFTPCLTKFTGYNIRGLLSKTLAFSSCLFALFLACNTAILFFPIPIQQRFPIAEAEPERLEQRS